MSPRPIEVPVEGLSDGVVLLRIGSDADVPRVTELVQDPEVTRWTTIPAGQTYAQTRDWMQRGMAGMASGSDLSLVITRADDGHVIGTIGLHDINRATGRAVCGYVLASEARGRGFAARSLRLISAYAFDALDLARIELTIERENRASRATATAAGFREEGFLRSYMRVAGKRRDMLIYSLLPGEITPARGTRDATLEG